jgi:hypothetical protein
MNNKPVSLHSERNGRGKKRMKRGISLRLFLLVRHLWEAKRREEMREEMKAYK